MKKLYYIITLILITWLVSCNQEELVNRETEDSRVNISVELPSDISATRAQIAVPVTHKLRCIIEVWTNTTSPILKYRQEIAVDGGVMPTFDFDLKRGDYNCLMWADFIKRDATATEVTTEDEVTYTHFEDTFYDTSDLNAVTIKEETATNLFDTDLCDGFYAKLEIKKNAATVQQVMRMKRPFAKLIVKENDAERFASLKSMTVSCRIPKQFSVATGEINKEMIVVTYDKTFGPENDSQVLLSEYVFVPSTGLSMESLIFSFTTDAGRSKCEVPAESIILKRNQQLIASGKLIESGTIETDPNPDPVVGDYFFIDGTWSSELTNDNKADCVGIVYAVGALNGDDISSYGEGAQGMRIKGYVMALKNTEIYKEDFPSENKQYILSNSRPYFYKQNKDVNGIDESVTVLSKAQNAPMWTIYNGYTATQKMLADVSFTTSVTPLDYPALYIFKKWKENRSKPANASEWYLPSSGQLLEAAGVCYGFTPNEIYGGNGATQTIIKNEAFSSAFNNAIQVGIAEYFSGGPSANGYFIYTSSLNKSAMPMIVQIGTNRVAPHAVPNYRTMGFIRPFLTIIK